MSWTRQIEETFESDSSQEKLQNLYDIWISYLKDLSSHFGVDGMTLSEQCILTSLLIMDVHRRDVIETLLSRAVSDSSDFEWMRYMYMCIMYNISYMYMYMHTFNVRLMSMIVLMALLLLSGTCDTTGVEMPLTNTLFDSALQPSAMAMNILDVRLGWL